MNNFEILIPLAAIFFGGMIVLIPVAGLTARIAIRPVLEALRAARGDQASDKRASYLEQRIALLEEQYHALEREQQKLLEEAEFRRQLDAPRL